MIEDADEDGSGSINFPEFVGLMMKKQEGSITKEEIKQVCILFSKKTDWVRARKRFVARGFM